MFRKFFIITFIISLFMMSFSCTNKKEAKMSFTGEKGEFKIMILNPGHFHAGLVQKTMYDQVSPTVYVYAPDGPDVEVYLKSVEDFNTRAENPTNWEEKVYTGFDFLEKMVAEKPGNVMITSGDNRKKTEYIKAAVDAGIHVLSDKPMCIDKKGFELLKTAFESARENNVLLYDIMTERHEIATILQKELVNNPEVFGELLSGSPDDPAVVKESVHHIFKYVAGSPIQRPAWYFDVIHQGEGLVDVSTHLVDLVMWECFPEQIIDYSTDIEMLRAEHWPTMLTLPQFEKVTKLTDFPGFLKSSLNENGDLPYYCNGEMIYRIHGIHVKVSVIWNFEAPEGSGDTHYSVMKGTRANVIILQDKEQNYRSELYVESREHADTAASGETLKKAIANLQNSFPGIALKKEGARWHIVIPESYRIGHEAHFGQVTEKYLGYLVDGKLPDWEVPNMIAKYYTTTKALEMALNND